MDENSTTTVSLCPLTRQIAQRCGIDPEQLVEKPFSYFLKISPQRSIKNAQSLYNQYEARRKKFLDIIAFQKMQHQNNTNSGILAGDNSDKHIIREMKYQSSRSDHTKSSVLNSSNYQTMKDNLPFEALCQKEQGRLEFRQNRIRKQLLDSSNLYKSYEAKLQTHEKNIETLKKERMEKKEFEMKVQTAKQNILEHKRMQSSQRDKEAVRERARLDTKALIEEAKKREEQAKLAAAEAYARDQANMQAMQNSQLALIETLDYEWYQNKDWLEAREEYQRQFYERKRQEMEQEKKERAMQAQKRAERAMRAREEAERKRNADRETLARKVQEATIRIQNFHDIRSEMNKHKFDVHQHRTIRRDHNLAKLEATRRQWIGDLEKMAEDYHSRTTNFELTRTRRHSDTLFLNTQKQEERNDRLRQMKKDNLYWRLQLQAKITKKVDKSRQIQSEKALFAKAKQEFDRQMLATKDRAFEELHSLKMNQLSVLEASADSPKS